MNKEKKSASNWALRLFKKSGLPAPTVHGKTYYAHRFHDNFLPEHNPLNDLFFGVEQKPTELPVSTDLKLTQALDQTQNNLSRPAENKTIGPHLTVTNSYDETPDTKTFHLADPAGRAFTYLPGQYITLSVQINDQEYKRSYSLASSPSRPQTLEITVKRDPNGGIVSNWLNDNLKIGDTVAVKGPFGKFSCLPHTPQKILFVAAGSGIVPIMSMLRWLSDTDANVDVVLLLSFRTLYDIIYCDELTLIAAHHKSVKLHFTLTQEPLYYNQWRGLAKHIDEKLIAKLVPDVSERAVYLCGPDVFMTGCRQFLQNLAVPTEQINCESFTVNSPQTIAHTNPQHSIVDRQPAFRLGSYQINFAKSGKTIAADGQHSLLELAEQSGIHIDHECRSGNCGECMIKCLEGQVEMTEQAEIDDINRKKGWVYSCCAYPATNVVLEI